MWPLKDKVTLVTGAAQGMGRAFAHRLCAAGARLAICDIDAATLARTEQELRNQGAAPLARSFDVADAIARRNFVDEVRRTLGPVDLLVNNAGVGTSGPFAEIAGDDWEWIRSINLDAPIDLMRLVLPEMLARGDGRILNVASVSGLMIQPHVSGYVATKHALVGLSRAVHAEVRPFGVAVTVACPGIVKTSILDRVRARTVDINSTRWLFRFGLEPDTAATRMLKAVQRGVPLVIPNHDARLIYALYRLCPGLWDGLLSRIAHRAFKDQQRRGGTGA